LDTKLTIASNALVLPPERPSNRADSGGERPPPRAQQGAARKPENLLLDERRTNLDAETIDCSNSN
jgi:hypothetical protein